MISKELGDLVGVEASNIIEETEGIPCGDSSLPASSRCSTVLNKKR